MITLLAELRMSLASGGEVWCFAIGAFVVYALITNKDSGSSGSTPSVGSFGARSRASMGAFEIRCREEMRGKSKNLRAIVIEARGLMPVYFPCRVEFVVTGRDVTNRARPERLLCTLEAYQMPDSLEFRSYDENGCNLSQGQGFGDWTEIGVAPTDCLVGPRSGMRRLEFKGMAVRNANRHQLQQNLDVICSATADLSVKLTSVGHEEKDEKQLEALGLSIKLALAVAFADGSLDASESRTIREWASRQVEKLPESERASAKAELNDIIRQAGEQARKGTLGIDNAAQDLVNNPVAGVKMQALELCVKVMSADGKIASEEMALVRRIATLLKINYEDLRKLTDKHPPAVQGDQSGAKSRQKPAATSDLSDEELVGLPPGLSRADIGKEIRKLFASYNARLSIEKDPSKRANYQRKLEALARLRQKYVSNG